MTFTDCIRRFFEILQERGVKQAFVSSYNFFSCNIIRILGIKLRVRCNVTVGDIDFNTMYAAEAEVPQNIVFPEQNTPLVSIIIPTYNNYAYTKKCLASIRQNVGSISYEVIIADDNSNDETVTICDEIKNITVIKNTKEKGFLQNCNNAAHFAKGKFIVFLNNDTQVFPLWLESLVETMENDERIGLVGSKLVYPDGSLQEAGGIIFSDGNGCNYGRDDVPSRVCYNYTRETDYISGASILLSKALWDDLCGFDERFSPAYYEDTDLAFRIRYEKELKVVYQPKSVVLHYEGKSNGTDIASGLKQYQVLNKEKFYDKWKNELNKFHYENADNLFFAKDHAKSKKNILVIDEKILTYSKDTGSRATYQYLHFFTDSGFNVKYYPHNINLQDRNFLEDHLSDGFEIILEGFSHFIKKYGKKFQYVYLNRPNIAPHYIKYLREYTNAKILYQCHDLHYLRRYRERILQGSKNAESLLEKEKAKEFAVFSQMDVVCSFSDEEIALIKQGNCTLPTCQIPLFILDAQKMDTISYEANAREHIIFVAGFGHPPNADAAVWFANEVFPLVQQGLGNVKFYIIGSNPRPEVVALQSEHVVVTGYVSEEKLEELYSQARLTVVPLRYGAGVKGKIVESLYNKVPVVTTTIGVEGIPNEDAFIDVADEAKNFAEAVVQLYQNENALQQKSLQCAEFIVKNYSSEAAKKKLAQFINF